MTDPEAQAPPPYGAAAHHLSLDLAEAFPTEVVAAADVALAARVSCSHGCDLQGAVLRLVSEEEVLAEGELERASAQEHAQRGLSVKAPVRVGEWRCSLVVPGVVIADVPHREATLDLTCQVLPHATSLAVWGVPSPVRGSAFRVTIGAKCSAGCPMHGQVVEVLDEAGVRVGHGELGKEPHAGTSALHAAEVTLTAPPTPGVFTRTARFSGTPLRLPHLDASVSFTFRALEPPEHTVTVCVVPKNFEPRRSGIEVWLGAYRGETDARGVARIGVPKGTFEMSAWRVDLETTSTTIDVTGDAMVEVEVEPRRVVDEDAERWG